MMELVVPQHVVRGQSVRLECNFNLDNVVLYSVKWYKDGNEFYRYVPKEKPPVLVFALPGVTVDVSQQHARPRAHTCPPATAAAANSRASVTHGPGGEGRGGRGHPCPIRVADEGA